MRSGVCVKICKFHVIRAEDISSQDISKDCQWASSQLAIHRHQGHWHHKVTNSSCISILQRSTDRPASCAAMRHCEMVLSALSIEVQDLCWQCFAMFGTSHWKTCGIVSLHPAQNRHLGDILSCFLLLFHYRWHRPLIQEQKQVWFHLQRAIEIEGQSPPTKGWHCSFDHQ